MLNLSAFDRRFSRHKLTIPFFRSGSAVIPFRAHRTLPIGGLFPALLNVVGEAPWVNQLLFSMVGPIIYYLVGQLLWDRVDRMDNRLG